MKDHWTGTAEVFKLREVHSMHMQSHGTNSDQFDAFTQLTMNSEWFIACAIEQCELRVVHHELQNKHKQFVRSNLCVVCFMQTIDCELRVVHDVQSNQSALLCAHAIT